MSDLEKNSALAGKTTGSLPEWVLGTRHGPIPLGRRTILMGVLNVTPDSFSDGGQFFDREKAIARGTTMVEEGADIIDIGGESTRPGAPAASLEEEIERVIPVIKELRRGISVPISIDTYKAEVARRALDEGADIVNDISALRLDPGMAGLIAREQVPVVLMHMQGTPRTMQINPHYDDVVREVRDFLRERLEFAESAGVQASRIVLDPGIGFGKSLEHNLVLLRQLAILTGVGCPVLVGVSRKRFLGKILGVAPQERLEGSLAAAVAAVLGGAHLIRAHDVKQTHRALKVADALRYGPTEAEFSDG